MLRGSRSITVNKKAPKSLKPQQARSLIRRFHILQKNKSSILSRIAKQNPTVTEKNYKSKLSKVYQEEYDKFRVSKTMEQFKVDDSVLMEPMTKMLARIDAEIEQRGGLHVYQMASTVGQNQKRGGDSLKKLVDWFKELNRTSQNALEIGCLSAENAILTSGMFGHIDRIDLNSQSPQILEQNFMERPLPTNDSERYEMISCSLVLNFVPTPKERGEMLKRITGFLKEPKDSHSGTSSLFLVLPLPCITNSRYFNASLLLEVMESLGFKEVKYYEAKKVAYWLYDWKGHHAMKRMPPQKKKELHGGGTRNNFYVDVSGI